jgi:hypothetical protein
MICIREAGTRSLRGGNGRIRVLCVVKEYRRQLFPCDGVVWGKEIAAHAADDIIFPGPGDGFGVVSAAGHIVEGRYAAYGRPGQIFDPQSPTTRAEAAAMLHRFVVKAGA